MRGKHPHLYLPPSRGKRFVGGLGAADWVVGRYSIGSCLRRNKNGEEEWAPAFAREREGSASIGGETLNLTFSQEGRREGTGKGVRRLLRWRGSGSGRVPGPGAGVRSG